MRILSKMLILCACLENKKIPYFFKFERYGIFFIVLKTYFIDHRRRKIHVFRTVLLLHLQDRKKGQDQFLQ